MFGRNNNPEETQREYSLNDFVEPLDENPGVYTSSPIDNQYSSSYLHPYGAPYEITNSHQQGLDANYSSSMTRNPYSRRTIPEYDTPYGDGYVKRYNNMFYRRLSSNRSPVYMNSAAAPENGLGIPPEMPYNPELLPPLSRSPFSIDMHDPNLREYYYQLQLQRQRQLQLQLQQPMYIPPSYPINREEDSYINPVNPVNSVNSVNPVTDNTGREQPFFSMPDPYRPSRLPYARYPVPTPQPSQPPYSPFSPRSTLSTRSSSYPSYTPMSEPSQDTSFTFLPSPTSRLSPNRDDHVPEEIGLPLPPIPVPSQYAPTTDTSSTPTDNANSTRIKVHTNSRVSTSPTSPDYSDKNANTNGIVASPNTRRKVDETYSPLTKEEVRRNIQQILNWPYYREIWNQLERTADGQSACLVQLLKQYPEDSLPPMNVLIRECISLKKACRMLSARKLFLSLLDAFDGDPLIWVDFSRMEMESGEYQNALFLLQAARMQYPYHQVLITKLVKVEEKLRMGSELIQLAQELIECGDPKIMRLLCDVLLSLARIGYAQYARTVTNQLAESLSTSPGWLCYEILSLMHYLEPLPVVRQAVTQIIKLCPKHGPMWIFAMRWTENMCIELWSRQSVYDLVHDQEYLSIVERAKKSLSADILWKVLLESMQGNARIMFILRFCFYTEIDYREKAIMEQYQQFINQARNCLELANSSQHWKIFATLARLAVTFGSPHLSQKLFKRALLLCPKKSHHEVLLDYGKALFAMLHKHEATALLSKGSLQFPEEWKLVLQLVQELLYQDRCLDALHLCRRATCVYFGAGRLWSLYIHLIHNHIDYYTGDHCKVITTVNYITSRLVGPIQALHYWRIALRYVAKSGEIWCEGARIFLNPASTLFSLHNARVALNYSVFFTPQYGDSFIEGARLLMLSSNPFLRFWDCPDKLLLSSFLLSTPSLYSFTRIAVYSNPNYGPMWYRCQSGLLSSMQETFIHAVRMCALTLAQHSEMYYDAIRRSARKKTIGRDKQPEFSFCFNQLSQGINMQYGRGRTPHPNMDYLFKALFGSFPIHMT